MTTQASASTTKSGPVPGIETLRFFAALWVALSHGAAPPLKHLIDTSGDISRIAVATINASFNGGAAVMAFFVISGFCIHLPNVGVERIGWQSFLVRRAIRICLPLAAIVAIVHALGPIYVKSEYEVLWTVYCELAYYALYPLIFVAFSRWGIVNVLLASATSSIALLAFNPSATYLWQFGPLTWLFCMPVWLMGALLAEAHRGRATLTYYGPLWVWRIGALAFCVASVVSVYHLPISIGYTWSLPAFGLYCLFWFHNEIDHFRRKGISPILEMIGASCYSIYLVHKLVITGFQQNFGPATSLADWLILIAGIAASTYLFYTLAERPAHLLARHLGKRRSTTVFAAP